MPGSPTNLRWLTLGAFAIGTEGFMIAGLLPALARDLNVSLPAVGNLVSAGHRRWHSGATRLGGSGIQRGRAAGGYLRRQGWRQVTDSSISSVMCHWCKPRFRRRKLSPGGKLPHSIG